MKEYLYYGEVQQRINEYVAEHGSTLGFYDAVRMLWQEGRCHQGAELPSASFQDWDVTDVAAFKNYMYRTPVDMERFYTGFEVGQSGYRHAELLPQWDVLPMMVAENQAVGIHAHDAFEMTYVLSGRGQLNLNGHIHGIGEGDLCILAPHYDHDAVVEGDGIILNFAFSEFTIEGTLYHVLAAESAVADFFRTNLGKGGGYGLFHMPPEPRLLQIIREIYHEAYCREPYSRQMCVSFTEIFFSCLMRSSTWDVARRGGEERDLRKGTSMLPIVKYIQDNFRTVTLQDVAERFHYEPGYLGKQLKSHLGKSYTQLVSDLRIEKAKTLLRGTGMTMERIAEQSGFQSAVNFSRSFRQHTGISPREYRKNAAVRK